MKRWFIVLPGLLLGLAIGVGLLMVNPLSLSQAAPAGLSGAVRVLDWRSGGGFRGMPMTPGGLLGWSRGADGFADPALRHARVEVVVLDDDASGEKVLGVRMSAAAAQGSLLRARLGVTTAWNLVWPGRGSVMLAGSENAWPMLRDGLWALARGRGFRPGREHYPLPPLPGAGAPALVSGSGAFEGLRGSFREDYRPIASMPGDLIGSRQLSLATESLP